MRFVPKINAVYWGGLVLASIFGANAGDFLSDALGLGHLAGIPYLAVGLALVFFAERFTPAPSPLYFWAAIIIIRASATNVGDAFHDVDIDFSLSVPLVAVLLVAAVAVWRRLRPPVAGEGFIPVNVFYWITMFVAGVLGTVAGDAVSYPLGLGNFGAMVAFAVPLAVLFFVGRHGLLTRLAYYWLVVAVIRSAGTAAGDLLAHGLDSIEWSTAISGTVFVATVVAAYALTKANSRSQRSVREVALP